MNEIGSFRPTKIAKEISMHFIKAKRHMEQYPRPKHAVVHLKTDKQSK